jgi:hypothetical protein
MTRKTESIRDRGFRRALISGVFAAAVLGVGAVAAPALADTLGYYYEETTVNPPPPPTTATTTTYTYTSPTYVEPAPVEVYEHREHREHGAGIHLDTPIFNFGVGVH